MKQRGPGWVEVRSRTCYLAQEAGSLGPGAAAGEAWCWRPSVAAPGGGNDLAPPCTYSWHLRCKRKEKRREDRVLRGKYKWEERKGEERKDKGREEGEKSSGRVENRKRGTGAE